MSMTETEPQTRKRKRRKGREQNRVMMCPCARGPNHRQRANPNSTFFATFASFALLRWGSVFAHPRLKNSRGPRIPLMRSNNKAKSDGRSTKFKFLLFTINTGAALYSWKKRPYATFNRVR